MLPSALSGKTNVSFEMLLDQLQRLSKSGFSEFFFILSHFIVQVPKRIAEFDYATPPPIAGVEKVSDHGTIGPRKYFGFQKETVQT